MHRPLSALLVLSALGCQEKKTEPPAPSTSAKTVQKTAKQAPTPRPQSKLTVTRDGKTVPMASAFAYKSWDGTVAFTVSSVPLSCADVTGDLRSYADGEVSFTVNAGQSLQPDGSFKGEQRSTWFDGMTKQETKPAKIEGDATAGAPTTIDVDFETESADGKAKLAVKGTIDALGCAATQKTVPPLPEPMAATLEVAGKKLPIRFARWSTLGDQRSIDLFTGSEGCKQVAFAPPSELRVDLAWFKADDPTVNQITLGGSLLSPKADQTYDKKKITVTPNPKGPGDYDVHADVTVMGYPVKIDGKLHVVDCPKGS